MQWQLTGEGAVVVGCSQQLLQQCSSVRLHPSASQLQRLSHNYEKLRSKKRHTGGGRAATSSGPASQEARSRSSEVARLKDQRDLLELRLREVEQEKGRVDSHLLASRNEIAALQGRLGGGGGRTVMSTALVQ